jgi:hypothetical protein
MRFRLFRRVISNLEEKDLARGFKDCQKSSGDPEGLTSAAENRLKGQLVFQRSGFGSASEKRKMNQTSKRNR